MGKEWRAGLPSSEANPAPVKSPTDFNMQLSKALNDSHTLTWTQVYIIYFLITESISVPIPTDATVELIVYGEQQGSSTGVDS